MQGAPRGAYSLYVTLFCNAGNGAKKCREFFSRQPLGMEANRTDAMSKDKQDVQFISARLLTRDAKRKTEPSVSKAGILGFAGCLTTDRVCERLPRDMDAVRKHGAIARKHPRYPSSRSPTGGGDHAAGGLVRQRAASVGNLASRQGQVRCISGLPGDGQAGPSRMRPRGRSAPGGHGGDCWHHECRRPGWR